MMISSTNGSPMLFTSSDNYEEEEYRGSDECVPKSFEDFQNIFKNSQVDNVASKPQSFYSEGSETNALELQRSQTSSENSDLEEESLDEELSPETLSFEGM